MATVIWQAAEQIYQNKKWSAADSPVQDQHSQQRMQDLKSLMYVRNGEQTAFDRFNGARAFCAVVQFLCGRGAHSGGHVQRAAPS